jgi:prepilin-type N-terminal cleavage/methylation domain-containing protein
MKTRLASRRAARGFTLVELLVVIAIIVVLAGMGVGVASRAMTNARKTQTLTDATQLRNGIEDFERDYARFPEFGAQGEESQTDGTSGAELLTILLGKEAVSSSMENKKQTPFVHFRTSKRKDTGGLVYTSGASGAPPEGLYDAWGSPFNVIIDSDHDGEVSDPLSPGNVVQESVIVYSYGPDKKPGGGDDVKTW